MATLPRLRPRSFYDLVVEIALIRPGPIQGGSVHPYIRRRNGEEPVTYLHPITEKALAKTLGVPLFQEQLMQLAMDVGGFTAAESDQLRQAMGSKRSRERMERLHQRFRDGAMERGVDVDTTEVLWEKLAAFANYGFPESHSVSFAYLVYSSSWLKRWYPAAFCAGLLNAQPMGFYSPHSLVQDAVRHGVTVRSVDLNASKAKAGLEIDTGTSIASVEGTAPATWGHGGPAVRLGLVSVKGLGHDLSAEIDAGRPYSSMEDLRRRVPALTLPQLEAMATAGAFDSCFGLSRRSALWQAGAVAQSSPDRLAGIVTGATAPCLPGMTSMEEAVADLWATGLSVDGHPTKFVRARLTEMGVVTSLQLRAMDDGVQVLVAGVVTHRQRPATASGITFVNLEDETGFVNVVVSRGCWARFRRTARSAPALLVRGLLERQGAVINIVAHRLDPLPVGAPVSSRDFR
jgi:error-prone DNA polymerase